MKHLYVHIARRTLLGLVEDLLKRFQQGWVTCRLWMAKQRRIRISVRTFVALFNWLYAPTLYTTLPDGVILGVIKDKRWSVFRRKAGDYNKKWG